MLITLARKPLTGSVAQNVLAHGCGALNIDSCRIEYQSAADAERHGREWDRTYNPETNSSPIHTWDSAIGNHPGAKRVEGGGVRQMTGRWPANILIDPTPAVLAHFPEVKGQVGMSKTVGGHRFMAGDLTTVQKFDHGKTDTGSAARFFKQILGD